MAKPASATTEPKILAMRTRTADGSREFKIASATAANKVASAVTGFMGTSPGATLRNAAMSSDHPVNASAPIAPASAAKPLATRRSDRE